MRKVPKIELDEVDLKIANILRDNARISYKKLGELVSLSSPSVYERVKKLEAKGALRGYKTDVDYGKFGYAIHAFILLKDDKIFRSADKYLSQLDFVQNCWVVSGEYDYLVEVYIENNDELNRVVYELYDHVGRTYTLLVIRDSRTGEPPDED